VPVGGGRAIAGGPVGVVEPAVGVGGGHAVGGCGGGGIGAVGVGGGPVGDGVRASTGSSLGSARRPSGPIKFSLSTKERPAYPVHLTTTLFAGPWDAWATSWGT